jgi:uncharacterized repeat protein (TIGR03837 family)
MAEQSPPPCWINLEYLSAESWVEDCHGLASPQRVGKLSLDKFFFFPGFTAKTGGLLCEQGLIAERERWQQDEAGLAAYWASLGLPPRAQDELRISLFTYESEALKSLVQCWSQGATPVTLLLPLGRSLNDVLSGAGLESAIDTTRAGDLLQAGQLAIKLLPMTSQADYDRLLWSCDLNLVRGEDSFVRAQWAARPFLWHIYPQDDQAHIAKLNDFLDHYLSSLPDLADLPTDAAHWLRAFNHALNHGQDVRELWAQWPQFGTIWQQHARSWSQKLLADGDLVTRLVKFLESRI